MSRKVQIAMTYLFTYTEEELAENFEIESDEDLEHAARITLFGENMNEYEADDIEIEIVEE